MAGHSFVPYDFERLPPEVMRERARAFYEPMEARRSVRDFSADPVPRELIELAVRTASTAPSGAHRQPWTFVLVGDSELRREMRVAAERSAIQPAERGCRTCGASRSGTSWSSPPEPYRTVYGPVETG
jgi:iodotyrosine deiodinase